MRRYIPHPSLSVAVLLLLLTLPAVVQAQFNYTINNGTITITKYTGPGGEVIIPDTIQELPVTSIAGCYSGCGAFSFCTSLTNVTIPNSVTNIGYQAFFSCTSLTNVTIGNGVIRIEDWAFGDCTSLTAITVDASNRVYSSMAGVLFDKNQTALIQCPGGKAGSYTIPSSVTSIGSRAFAYCHSLTSVTIPNSVTSIGSWAFYYSDSLASVTIGNSVTIINGYAFGFCASLTSITIPNSVTSIRENAFEECHSLTNAAIGNSVTSIGDYAFAWCDSLPNVTIGDSVTSLGDGAFRSCYSLASVYFQGNAPSLGPDTFSGDNNATVYYLPGTTGWSTTFGGRPTALWFLRYPLILNNSPIFGVQSNGFCFIISWATNRHVVVEACTNLANHTWSPLATNSLTNGSACFSDAQWTNYPGRFYRLRLQ
jgi:hypothetical protein